MNYSSRYEKLRLDELGIPSHEEAEELEYELELSFGDFTPSDRKTWLRQSDYLEHFSRTGTVSSAAKNAGVTIYRAQGWRYENELGFTRRNEVASLIFNDRLKEIALLRASDPKAPVTLLIELLRAYIPEEFSRNGHKCDSSKADELLRRYREDARREKDAGHPGLRKLAENAENVYPEDLPTEPDAYPDDNYHTDMNDYPATSHLSPAGGETQRGGSSHPTPYGHEPSHAGTSSRTTIRDWNPQNPSAPSAVNPLTPERRVLPNRAQRRAQLRQQRKKEKKNTFPVKRF